jgi:hypothetical protein
MRTLVVFLALTAATPALAATITETGPGTGTALELKLSEFTRLGACGTGLSIIGDSCTGPVFGPDGEKPFGRFSPSGGKFVTSRDTDKMRWDVNFGRANEITFAITDANDQPDDRPEGASFFRFKVAGATASVAKGPNASLHWFTVAFERVRTRASFLFESGLNDGFAVSDVTTVCRPK